MKIFGREPTLYIATIDAVVVIVGTLGLHIISGAQAALIVAAINAVAGAINAWAVRPISPVAFTYAVGAAAALVAGYGFNVSDASLSAINLAVVPVLALLSRGQVSPEETPVSKS